MPGASPEGAIPLRALTTGVAGVLVLSLALTPEHLGLHQSPPVRAPGPHGGLGGARAVRRVAAPREPQQAQRLAPGMTK